MADAVNSETVTILLLGDPGCGKSTFLARLKEGVRKSGIQTIPSASQSLELLHDEDQPFVYDIRFSKKWFTLECYDTASPNQHWTTLNPDVVVIAFDISNRQTLEGLKTWRHDVIRYFQQGSGERIPVAIVGLKRDLRAEGPEIIYPQEAYRIAQELRCDMYAECSALTGELMAETFEDIARVAAMTTTEQGGQTAGGCMIM